MADTAVYTGVTLKTAQGACEDVKKGLVLSLDGEHLNAYPINLNKDELRKIVYTIWDANW